MAEVSAASSSASRGLAGGRAVEAECSFGFNDAEMLWMELGVGEGCGPTQASVSSICC